MANTYSSSDSPSNAIVVATPKQLTVEILRQSDTILELKRWMKPGVHFGPPYPGSKKDTLLKPGAEWLAKRFGLRSHYEELTKRIDIDFDTPWRTFILLEYRCLMIDIETGVVVGEAIGSCNSLEDKYAWRWVGEFDVPDSMDKSRLLKRDGALTEFKFAVEKAETSGKYAKPAEYWQQFKDAIAAGTAILIDKEDSKGVKRPAYVIGGLTYRIRNENPLDQLNTFSKMAQKRSKVSSVMEATGASAYFSPGDDEVKDIYVEDGDIEVIDAEFVEVTEAVASSKTEHSQSPNSTPASQPAPINTTAKANAASSDTFGTQFPTQQRATQDALYPHVSSYFNAKEHFANFWAKHAEMLTNVTLEEAALFVKQQHWNYDVARCNDLKALAASLYEMSAADVLEALTTANGHSVKKWRDWDGGNWTFAQAALLAWHAGYVIAQVHAISNKQAIAEGIWFEAIHICEAYDRVHAGQKEQVAS